MREGDMWHRDDVMNVVRQVDIQLIARRCTAEDLANAPDGDVLGDLAAAPTEALQRYRKTLVDMLEREDRLAVSNATTDAARWTKWTAIATAITALAALAATLVALAGR